MAGTAHASHLVLQPTPDVFLQSVLITYDHVSGDFTASGSADLLTDLSGTFGITSGAFLLNATIDNSGVASAGQLTINGYIFDAFSSPLYPPYSGTLLEGSLTDFEYVGGPFETGELTFSFAPTGGDLQTLYQNRAIVKLNLNSGFPGSFASTFSSPDLANVGDVGVSATATATPEPGTWALFVLGGAAVWAGRRRRSAGPSL